MSRGRKAIVLVNDIKEAFCDQWWGRDDYDVWPVWIDDIVSGIARLDWYGDRDNQVPLSTSNIIKCFVFLDEISTQTVMELLSIKKSQASLYVKACALCYRFFKKSLADPKVLALKYPRRSVVSEMHGIEMGYHKANKLFI